MNHSHNHEIIAIPISWDESWEIDSTMEMGNIVCSSSSLIQGIICPRYGFDSYPVFSAMVEQCPHDIDNPDEKRLFIKLRNSGKYPAHSFPQGIQLQATIGPYIIYEVKPYTGFVNIMIDLAMDIIRCWNKVKNIKSEALQERFNTLQELLAIGMVKRQKELMCWQKWFLDNKHGSIAANCSIRFNFMPPIPEDILTRISGNKDFLQFTDYFEMLDYMEKEGERLTRHDPLEKAQDFIARSSLMNID